MNKKELNEIRRRLACDKNNIGKIYGCYINDRKEIISHISESTLLMSEFELEKYLSIFKKTLSGSFGHNLTELEFTVEQVTSSSEHKLLTDLRASGGKDSELLDKFYQNIIDAMHVEDCNYLILIAFDTYDVPTHDKNGEKAEDSDTVFPYFICSICPVKDEKSQLGYSSPDEKFRTHASNQIVGSPCLGFMFPAFEDRCANIYKTVYYAKETSSLDSEFIKNVFNTSVPMTSVEKKEAFSATLSEILEEDCSLEVVQAVQEHLRERIEQHKLSKSPDELDISVSEIGSVLKSDGINDDKIENFQKKCVEQFGDNTSLDPSSIIDTNKFVLTTPQVKISVDPEYSYMVETKIIDGVKYIAIPASEGVEVNGVAITIATDK